MTSEDFGWYSDWLIVSANDIESKAEDEDKNEDGKD